MKKALITGLVTLALVACSKGDDTSKQNATIVAGGDTALKRPSSSAPRPAASAPRSAASRTLASGTSVSGSMSSGLNSRTNKPGEAVHATVSSDVKDSRGNTVIPAGSTINMTIDKLEPGSDQVRPEGRLMLNVNSFSVNGREYPVSASIGPIPHTMKGRGVTTDEAARIAAGTAIGAIAGHAIGGNNKGTVVGGAVGAVAGGAVATKYAYRDVIVAAGAPITITLNSPLTVAVR